MVFAKYADWPDLIINRVECRARLKPTLILAFSLKGRRDGTFPLHVRERVRVRVIPNRRGR
jgi:hypothetical protein